MLGWLEDLKWSCWSCAERREEQKWDQGGWQGEGLHPTRDVVVLIRG